MNDPLLPKPLVSVGGRPMLERVLIGLARSGYQRVVIVIGYRGELIKRRFGTLFEGMHLNYAVQHEQEGTAHAVSCAAELVSDESAVLLAWSDILVSPSWYSTLTTLWSLRTCFVAMITVVSSNPSLGSLVEFDEKLHMTNIVSRPETITSGWRDGGISIYDADSIATMAHVVKSNRGEKQVTTAIQNLLTRGQLVGVAKYSGPWYDLATPEAIREAEAEFLEFFE